MSHKCSFFATNTDTKAQKQNTEILVSFFYFSGACSASCFSPLRKLVLQWDWEPSFSLAGLSCINRRSGLNNKIVVTIFSHRQKKRSIKRAGLLQMGNRPWPNFINFGQLKHRKLLESAHFISYASYRNCLCYPENTKAFVKNRCKMKLYTWVKGRIPKKWKQFKSFSIRRRPPL